MNMLHRILAVLAALAVTSVTACNRIKGCPPGMDPVASASAEGQHLVCSDAKGIQKVWIELHSRAEGAPTPRQICPFEKNLLVGPFKSFHPNGKEWIRGGYSGGQKSGLWVQFNDSGLKVAEGEYRRGQLAAGAPVAIAAKCEQVKL